MKAWNHFDFIAPSSRLYKNVRFFLLYCKFPMWLFVHIVAYTDASLSVLIRVCVCVYQWNRQKLERWIERPSNFLFKIGCSPSDENVGITNKCLSQIGILWESCIYLCNKIFSFATKNGTLSIIIFTLPLV